MSITITIDKKPFAAEKGETILQVAERNGISIPTLCFNQKITKTT
ncbi:MAG TPA: 2Fe-2S iron-sulfur cluster-binding protein, partial [bacterium]|nr:2Fe-2S iron-sulfur cluster-binding protein [bacterium]